MSAMSVGIGTDDFNQSFTACSIIVAYIVLVCVCECVSSCTVRGGAPDGVLISQFITLLPHF